MFSRILFTISLALAFPNVHATSFAFLNSPLVGVLCTETEIFDNCMEERKQSITTPSGTIDDPSQLYNLDVKTCKCINANSNKLGNMIESMEGSMLERERLTIIRRKYQSLKSLLESASNGMTLNRFALAVDDVSASQSLVFSMIRPKDPEQKNELELKLLQKKTDLLKELSRSGELSEQAQELKAEIEQFMPTATIAGTNTTGVRPPALDNISTYTEINQNSCVSRQMYEGYKILPTTDEFYIKLQQEPVFDPAKWDYKTLWSQRSISSDAESLYIKSRIEFLKNNPLLRELFSAGRSDPDIKSAQDQAFELVKSLAPKGSSCLTSDKVNCWHEIMDKHDEGRKFNDYRSKLSAILDAPNLKMKLLDNTGERLKSDLNKPLEIPLKLDDKPAKILSPESYVRSLLRDSSPLLNECKKPADCRNDMLFQCRRLPLENEGAFFTTGPVSSIAKIRQSADDSKLGREEGFKEFVKEKCETRYKNSKNQLKSFNEWNRVMCGSVIKLSKNCKVQQDLLAEFFEEYNLTEGGDHEVVEGFAHFVEYAKFGKVTEAQYQTASTWRKSFSDFAKDFGDTAFITSTGTIDRVAPVSAQSFSSSTSSNTAVASGNSIRANSPTTPVATSFEDNSAANPYSFAPTSTNFTTPTVVEPTREIQPKVADVNRENAIKDDIQEKVRLRDEAFNQNDSARVKALESQIEEMKNEAKLANNRMNSVVDKMIDRTLNSERSKPAAVDNAEPSARDEQRSALANATTAGSSGGLNNGAQTAGVQSGRSLASVNSSPLPGGASSIASVGGNKDESLLVNRALLAADEQKKGSGIQPTLIISGTAGTSAQRKQEVPVPPEIFAQLERAQQEENGDPEAIGKYATIVDDGRSTYYLEVNIKGRSNQKKLDVVAIKQASGKFNFFWPHQVEQIQRESAKSMPSTVKREPASTLPNLKALFEQNKGLPTLINP